MRQRNDEGMKSGIDDKGWEEGGGCSIPFYQLRSALRLESATRGLEQ